MNPIANQLANGRRIAARSLIMNGGISVFQAAIYRRTVTGTKAAEDRDDEAWGGIGTTTDSDNHAVDYSELGPAKMMLDRFSGGGMLDNGDLVNPEVATSMAVIEPYDDSTLEDDRAVTIPDWEPAVGDLVAMIVDTKLIVWMEVVGIPSQTIMQDHGKRYFLNKRDDLTYMEPFATEFAER